VNLALMVAAGAGGGAADGSRIGTAIDTMFSLQSAGTDLIQAGFTPQFTFA
jgi:hypothetical protein